MASTSLLFPSVEWLQAVREVFNTSEQYRGTGSGRCDCLVGLKVDNELFRVDFEGFGCESVKEASQADLDEADFYIEMPSDEWKAMLDNIRTNGHAVGEYTINTLDLGREEGIAHSTHGDQYRQDLFVRYNQTMQFFFDASSRVATTYERA